MQSVLRNGDVVKIITSKKVSPSLHWLTSTKTGKARAAIRRYWQYRENTKPLKQKRYNTTLWISLEDEPGKLGDVTTMIGINNVLDFHFYQLSRQDLLTNHTLSMLMN